MIVRVLTNKFMKESTSATADFADLYRTYCQYCRSLSDSSVKLSQDEIRAADVMSAMTWPLGNGK